MSGPSRSKVLLVRAGSRMCALPLGDVVETMRPLPLAPLAGTPASVLGAAVVRGEPIPVVDLDALLGSTAAQRASRLVVVRVGERRAALAVQEVAGVVEMTEDAERVTAPLLDGAAAGAIEELRTRDGALVVVLAAARLVPDDVWRALASPWADA